ncbi:MAG TPA: L,D-transpeptidase [Crenotrichaceae bacterium]|nr:L,D-transpeptidase [Crenotrichaceae bacterium]
MRFLSAGVLCFFLFPCSAAIFPLPPWGTDLVGVLNTVSARQQDTLLDIAKQYNIGQTEISISNPGVDRWLPGKNTRILLPTRYILPDAKRKGIVLNIPEMRLYYYPETEKNQQRTVETFPVSIGRMDWQTPLGDARIIDKTVNPVWRPPKSIKKEHAEAGDPLPDVVPAGPDNPLGNYAMRLNLPGYLIHSTNKPLGIGMRVTHGCVRMYPTDIEQLFPKIKVGTRVQIVNQPVKIGWFADSLYLEVHPPLEEENIDTGWLEEQANLLISVATETLPVALNQNKIKTAIKDQTGVPVLIGQRIEHPVSRGYLPEGAPQSMTEEKLNTP